MKVFVDTNVFIASLTEEPNRGDVATELLNQDHDFCTSVLNLMEIRSVMTKKKRAEQARVETVLEDLQSRVDIYAPEISDQITAYNLQKDTLLYTMDCLLLSLAEDIGATMVTFDSELVANGASEPADVLE
ncbi:MAG: type II toxin-antitoxin system VapC family toxin [Haloarculaceae archaeon]